MSEELKQLRLIAHLAANLEMVHNDGRLAQALRDWYNPHGSGSDWQTRHPDAEPLYAKEQSAVDAKTITVHGTEVTYLDEQLKSAVELVRELRLKLVETSGWAVTVDDYRNVRELIAKADKWLEGVK